MILTNGSVVFNNFISAALDLVWEYKRGVLDNGFFAPPSFPTNSTELSHFLSHLLFLFINFTSYIYDRSDLIGIVNMEKGLCK